LNKPYPPKTWLVESIILILAFIIPQLLYFLILEDRFVIMQILIPFISVLLISVLPFGIMGIIYTNKVNNLYNFGDYEGAKKASEEAKHWLIIGLIIGIISIISIPHIYYYQVFE